MKMDKNKKIIIAGVGAIIAYLCLQGNKGKTLDIYKVVIYPTEFLC